MTPTIAEIITATAEAFEVNRADITGPSRQTVFTHPRFAVFALAREAGYTMPAIGARIGGRDHSTVLSGLRRITVICATDRQFRETYTALQTQLFGKAVFIRAVKFTSQRAAA